MALAIRTAERVTRKLQESCLELSGYPLDGVDLSPTKAAYLLKMNAYSNCKNTGVRLFALEAGRA